MKDRKKAMIAIILGLVVVLVLILLGVRRCGKDEGLSDKKPDVPNSQGIGETITGEEIEDEDAIIVDSSDDGRDDTDVSVNAEDLDEEDSSQNSDKNSDKKDENKPNKKPNKKPDDDGETDDDEEETPSETPDQPSDDDEEEQPPQPPVKPDEDEEPGQSGDDEAEGAGKWGGIWF